MMFVFFSHIRSFRNKAGLSRSLEMDFNLNAPRVFQNAEWKVSDFFEKWLRGQCIKPLIQRRIRWQDDQRRKYLEEFLFPIRDSGNPIHVNRTIKQVNHTHVDLYTIFDGNNRTNCILDFVLGPLNYFPEWIPSALSVAGKERLMQTPLTYLQSYPMHVMKWCSPYQENPENNDPFLLKIEVLQTGLDEPFTPELCRQFDAMLARLGQLRFFDIKIMVKIWDNLSSEQMCKMYESLNTSMSALTKQEMMACSTFHTRYFPNELKEHFEPMFDLIRSYYADMNRSERLQLQEMIADSLSTFEVLAGFQMHLHHLFGWKPKASNGFIDTFAWAVKSNKNDDSKKQKEPKNLLFELYHDMKMPTDEKLPGMYEFLTWVKQACQRLFDNYHELYEGELSFHRAKKLSPHATKMLILYLMKHDGDFEDNVRNYLRRVCAYHDLVGELDKEDKEKQDHFLKKDALHNPRGKFAHNMIRELLETGTFSTGPSNDDLLELTQELIQQDVHHPQATRKAWKSNTLKMLCMTAFFNLRVPSMQKQLPNAIDHIVPFSQRHPHSHDKIDICRLGNLTVIPAKANHERGVKPITDEWIRKNGFKYQEYPSEVEYRAMVVANRLEHEELFTEVCERRERMYVEDLLRMCEA